MPIVLVLVGILPFLLVIYLFIHEKLNVTDTMVLLAALVLFSILTGYSLMRQSADNLALLARETAVIRTDEENRLIEITADEELTDIADNFNILIKRLNTLNREIKEQSVQLMTYGRDLSLSYQKIKEQDELRNKLIRYVGNNVVEKLVSSKNAMFLESERKHTTVLFADIRSFSAFSERVDAEEVVATLNQFFRIMVQIIFTHNGILDKFIGDELMAVFGVISSHDGGAADAVKAGLEMQAAVDELMAARQREGKVTYGIGVGINTGQTIVGSVGCDERMDYTVIGDSVNMAARLEQMAREGEIIIGEETYLRTRGCFRTEKKGNILIKNRVEPIVCYSVLCDTAARET